ncbi:hypothetical protein DZC72_10915 [Maribacter algicola]|uniref:Uncharacterized protein n=1 Tax=Maribacter algicola TaxID=2498892 RepID=A0A3R8RLF8_9FLAO|nr:hypothetical protein DZC72_10915 [Maribacter algicola]
MLRLSIWKTIFNDFCYNKFFFSAYVSKFRGFRLILKIAFVLFLYLTFLGIVIVALLKKLL